MMTARPKYTTTEVKQFIAKMKAAKQAERVGNVKVFDDVLLRARLVVEVGGELRIVPCHPGGWASRQRLSGRQQSRNE